MIRKCPWWGKNVKVWGRQHPNSAWRRTPGEAWGRWGECGGDGYCRAWCTKQRWGNRRQGRRGWKCPKREDSCWGVGTALSRWPKKSLKGFKPGGGARSDFHFFKEILALVWNINWRQEGRRREQAAMAGRGVQMREDVGVSQPAVIDRQKAGVSETTSKASKRRGDWVGLGCISPVSLGGAQWGTHPGKEGRFWHPQTAWGDAKRPVSWD